LAFPDPASRRAFGRGPEGRTVGTSGLGVLLALLALLLQGLVPLVPPGVAASRDDAGYASFISAFGDHGPLCLQRDGDTRSGEPARKAPGRETPRCPLCQALHAVAGYLPPVDIAVPAPPGGTDPIVPTLAAIGHLQWATLDGSPRGPPATA
jgi:hypothetical protein